MYGDNLCAFNIFANQGKPKPLKVLLPHTLITLWGCRVMKTLLKMNLKHKKGNFEAERIQEYEYEIKNREGEKFHVSVHREIKKRNILKH